MSERPLINIFVGERAKATHFIAGSAFAKKDESKKLIYASFQIWEDNPVAHGEIENVTVETVGEITESEKMFVMQGLAEEYIGRTGASARFYVDHKQ